RELAPEAVRLALRVAAHAVQAGSRAAVGAGQALVAVRRAGQALLLTADRADLLHADLVPRGRAAESVDIANRGDAPVAPGHQRRPRGAFAVSAGAGDAAGAILTSACAALHGAVARAAVPLAGQPADPIGPAEPRATIHGTLAERPVRSALVA